MKIIISPAKSLDFQSIVPTSLHTQPLFLEQSTKLNQELKTLSKKKLSDLMSISEDLASLNYERNQTWQTPFTPENSKQAIYAFTGEVFRGIDINTLPIEKLPLLQENLRILSGLYGLLKPLDLMQPYRLEMGTKLPVGSKKNLYNFWGDSIANALNEELSENELLINLASSEYFKVVNQKILKVPMITPVFKDFKSGQYKTIMTFAKKTRGLMVRYIIDNNIKTIDRLKHFDIENYRFHENMSSKNELVFTR
jgi:uncharacterized protein